MSDETSEGCFAIVVIAAMGLVAFMGSCSWNEYTCSQLQAEIGKPTRYAVFVGCLVQIDGQWVPVQNWRATK